MTAKPEPIRVPKILPPSGSCGLDSEPTRVRADVQASFGRGTICRRFWAKEGQD